MEVVDGRGDRREQQGGQCSGHELANQGIKEPREDFGYAWMRCDQPAGAGRKRGKDRGGQHDRGDALDFVHGPTPWQNHFWQNHSAGNGFAVISAVLGSAEIGCGALSWRRVSTKALSIRSWSNSSIEGVSSFGQMT